MAETKTATPAATAKAAPVDAWLTGIREAAELPAKPYRRGGDESWTPGSDGPIKPQEQRAAERLAEFTRLREDGGLKVGEAARRVGVTHQTGSKYEAARKARLAAVDPAGGAR